MKSMSFLLLVTILASCSAVQKNRLVKVGKEPLQKEQLETLLSAHGLRLETIDFDAELTFTEDGRFAAQTRTNDQDTGKWTVNEDNHLCLKFNSWYFSDLHCYEVFEESPGTLALFTKNGARAYSATVLGADHPPQPASTVKKKQLEQEEQNGSSRQTTASPPDRSSKARTQETRVTLNNLAANCPGCNFNNADLHNMKLIAAELPDANLRNANLSGANLRRANLAGADLAGANMRNANLAGANLQNANLEGADLSGANLIKADLTNAKYANANFSNAYLEGIQGYSNKP